MSGPHANRDVSIYEMSEALCVMRIASLSVQIPDNSLQVVDLLTAQRQSGPCSCRCYQVESLCIFNHQLNTISTSQPWQSITQQKLPGTCEDYLFVSKQHPAKRSLVVSCDV